MTDQELLQAIGQVVEAKMEPMWQDIRELKEDVRELKIEVGELTADVEGLKVDVEGLKADVEGLKGGHILLDKRLSVLGEQVTNVRIYLDTEQKKTLNLLLEGQQALWDRFVPHEKFDPLEDRTEVLELTVRRHSQEIRELQLA